MADDKLDALLRTTDNATMSLEQSRKFNNTKRKINAIFEVLKYEVKFLVDGVIFETQFVEVGSDVKANDSQPLNALSPMLVTPFGSDVNANEVQLENAFIPIFVALLGSDVNANEVQL